MILRFVGFLMVLASVVAILWCGNALAEQRTTTGIVFDTSTLNLMVTLVFAGIAVAYGYGFLGSTVKRHDGELRSLSAPNGLLVRMGQVEVKLETACERVARVEAQNLAVIAAITDVSAEIKGLRSDFQDTRRDDRERS
jgi:hypothetical protein